MTLKLYYVISRIDDVQTGFVMAETVAQAYHMFVEWACETFSYDRDNPTFTPVAFAGIQCIFELTVPAHAGAIDWHSSNLTLAWRDADDIPEMLVPEPGAGFDADANGYCSMGIHSWSDEIGILPADTACANCGELYGEPK